MQDEIFLLGNLVSESKSVREYFKTIFVKPVMLKNVLVQNRNECD